MHFLKSLISLMRDLLLVLAVSVPVYALIINVDDVEEFIERHLEKDLGSAELKNLTFVFEKEKEKTKQEQVGHISGYHSIEGSLRLLDVSFDEKADGVEYVLVEAKENVDLSSGFIGDAEDLLQIPDIDEAELNPGDRLFIYTCVAYNNAESHDSPKINMFKEHRDAGNAVLAKSTNANEDEETPFCEDGEFKYKVGKGDMVILLDSNNRPVMAFTYWAVAPSGK